MIERFLLRAVKVDIEKAHSKLARIVHGVASLIKAHLVRAYQVVVLRLVHARSLERVIDIILFFIGCHFQ